MLRCGGSSHHFAAPGPMRAFSQSGESSRLSGAADWKPAVGKRQKKKPLFLSTESSHRCAEPLHRIVVGPHSHLCLCRRRQSHIRRHKVEAGQQTARQTGLRFFKSESQSSSTGTSGTATPKSTACRGPTLMGKPVERAWPRRPECPAALCLGL